MEPGNKGAPAISLTSRKRKANPVVLVLQCGRFTVFDLSVYKDSQDEELLGKQVVTLRECNQAQRGITVIVALTHT